jgi:hypothetical protein
MEPIAALGHRPTIGREHTSQVESKTEKPTGVLLTPRLAELEFAALTPGLRLRQRQEPVTFAPGRRFFYWLRTLIRTASGRKRSSATCRVAQP